VRDAAGVSSMTGQDGVPTALRETPRTLGARLWVWRWPVALTAGLAAGALSCETVLRDAVTRQPVSDVTLRRPLAYVVLAPFCQALDALTLLSSRQHYALLATTVLLLVAWRVAPGLGRGRWRPLHDLAAVVAGILLLLSIYVVCIFVPRPMASLRVTDPEIVVVDFHSHTNFSWDGHETFTAERNRAWHRAGGWHAAYVTDHMQFEGAKLGMAGNPHRAGDDTVLLPGVEARANGLHLLVLGMTAADLATLRSDLATRGTRMRDGRDHSVILTLPGKLARMSDRAHTRAGTPVGIEVSDAGPRGLDQLQREHEAVMTIAERQNFAPVAGSNTHGWSQTPAAWSLLRIPGWRDLTPDALGARIEASMREEGFRAARVIERHGADPGATRLGLAATVPAVGWHVLATLTPAERISCLVWIWALALAERQLRRRRA
jgi:hypothetical protein